MDCLLPPRCRQSGLTLVELMIALALGLLLLAAMGYLYVGNRQTYRTLDSVARLQENGRYAMEVLGQDLRMVGYIGCGALGEVPINAAANVGAPVAVPTPANVLEGTEGDTGADSLRLMRVDGRGAALSAPMTNVDDPIPIPASPRQHAAGTYFLIADCLKADLFRNSEDVNTGAITIKHAAAGGYNTSDNLGKAYGADALVFPFESIAYRIYTNPAGNPPHRSLYRAVNGTDQEVVENVKDMQIVYGVDSNGDGAVDVYVTADKVSDWARVLAVRVSLLLRSHKDGVATGPQMVFWDRDNDGNNDFDPDADPDVQARRLLYVFTSTFGLRNRLR